MTSNPNSEHYWPRLVILTVLSVSILGTRISRGADPGRPVPSSNESPANAGALGQFDGHNDVGKVQRPGSVEFAADKQQYRVTGSGENIWGKKDAFHIAWRKVSADLSLQADVTWIGTGKNEHRKACLMVRQSLDADAPYADVAVHGNGLISLQFRKTAGGETQQVASRIKAPATVLLQRKGDLFTLSISEPGKPFQQAGSVTVVLSDPVYAGLVVSSHDAATDETALFAGVVLKNSIRQPGRQ